MIEVRGLIKRFGRQNVLKGIDLNVAEGETVALLGPNGAGKTTLIRILATLIRATSGQVRMAGVDLARGGEALRRYIGLVSHAPLLYGSLTALENLQFFGRLYDVPDLNRRVEEVLHLVGLWPRRNDLVRTFSRGMVQRLAIARATLHNPPVLLLDEPDTGLDQQAAEMLHAVLTDVGNRTVLLTTHNLERGRNWSDRILVLNGGRIVWEAASGSVDDDALRIAYRQAVEGATT